MRSEVYVGDRVRTRDGFEGHVTKVVTWRSAVLAMRDAEAKAFTEECRLACGVDFKEKWVRILVRFKNRSEWFGTNEFEVLEGRGNVGEKQTVGVAADREEVAREDG